MGNTLRDAAPIAMHLIVYLLLVVLPLVTGCTGTARVMESEPSAAALPAEPPSSSARDTVPVLDAVQWFHAANYIGKKVTICGRVAGAYWAESSRGKPTFINIGKPYPEPERFTVIIWGRNRDNFSHPVEKYYEGKTVCVTGMVIEYNGMPEMEVKSPDQITVR